MTKNVSDMYNATAIFSETPNDINILGLMMREVIGGKTMIPPTINAKGILYFIFKLFGYALIIPNFEKLISSRRIDLIKNASASPAENKSCAPRMAHAQQEKAAENGE